MLNLKPPSRPERPPYLDTPGGIVTASGTRFHTTEALLEAFAGPVLRAVPLRVLVRRAEVWRQSGEAAALWALAGFLLVLPPLGAAACALTVYVGWQTLAPALVSRRLVTLFRALEHPLVQGILFVAVLSALGARGELVAVAVGLAGFVLVRWRLLGFALRPLLALLRRPLYTLPVPDQVLRAFVLRAALEHDIRLPELERLKNELRGQ
ncbi:MAG: hypothetical protein R3362_00540 [Rhodothermales bacterium]|nr:hypothetical protein [Rhodothermales bacterium]